MLADPLRLLEEDTAWFVEDFDARTNRVSFVRATRDLLTRPVFLDHRWDRTRLERVEIPLAALTERWAPVPPASSPNFIWHTSYCCSSLIAEVLDKPGVNLSLREPLALVSVADAKRTAQLGRLHLPERAIEFVLRVLGRPRAQGEKILLKPSNFANNLVEDTARLRVGRVLFLYSSLESFLISIAKGGDRLGKYVRRLFGNLACDVGETFPWPAHEVLQMSDLEVAALCWHLQIAQFERNSAAFVQGRWASLDCDDFLDRPEDTIRALASFFEIAMTPDDIRAIVQGPAMSRHAKQPMYPFDARSRRLLNDEVRRRLGADLSRIAEWSQRAPGHSNPHGALAKGRLL